MLHNLIDSPAQIEFVGLLSVQIKQEPLIS